MTTINNCGNRNGGVANGDARGRGDSNGKPRNVVENEMADAHVEQLAATGVPRATADANAEEAGKGPEEEGQPALTREEVVHEFFSYMFPDTFQLALPVLRHKVRAAGWVPCHILSESTHFCTSYTGVCCWHIVLCAASGTPCYRSALPGCDARAVSGSPVG